jgi:hypothetical protein
MLKEGAAGLRPVERRAKKIGLSVRGPLPGHARQAGSRAFKGVGVLRAPFY